MARQRPAGSRTYDRERGDVLTVVALWISGRCGAHCFCRTRRAGITDIAMNSLGYTWRDNADCLSVSLDPRADFIYAGGNASGYGVVLAEAHGSFSPSISNASIGGRATRKYLRQVKPKSDGITWMTRPWQRIDAIIRV